MKRRCGRRRNKGELRGGVSGKRRLWVGADGRGRFGVDCPAARRALPLHTPAYFCIHISRVRLLKTGSRAVAPLFYCFAFGASHASLKTECTIWPVSKPRELRLLSSSRSNFVPNMMGAGLFRSDTKSCGG